MQSEFPRDWVLAQSLRRAVAFEPSLPFLLPAVQLLRSVELPAQESS